MTAIFYPAGQCDKHKIKITALSLNQFLKFLYMWLNLWLKSRHADKVPQILSGVRAVSLPLKRSEQSSSFKRPFTDLMRKCTSCGNLGVLLYSKTQLSLLARLSQALGQQLGLDVVWERARAQALSWAQGAAVLHRAAAKGRLCRTGLCQSTWDRWGTRASGPTVGPVALPP